MKYFFSIFLILTIIITMNMVTLNNTKHNVEVLENCLNDLKKVVRYENIDELNSKIENLKNNWDKANDLLALYIEHEELDKAETEIITIKSCIETEEYEDALQSIDRAIYQINHIEEKNRLKLKNIF